MRIKGNFTVRQARLLLLLGLMACAGDKEEIPVIPPATSPLSRTLIGYGVINVSYTHVTAAPEDGSASLGYLRRGSLVRVLERKMVAGGKSPESWVLAEGSSKGWVREAVMEIYDNQGQAETAAESMSR